MADFKKLALVARDWLAGDDVTQDAFSDGNMGFSPYFADIIRVADRQSAELVLFSPWSHDEGRLGPLGREQLFPRGTRHEAVVIEVSSGQQAPRIELHLRSPPGPRFFAQQFGKSADRVWKKKKFIDELSSRRFGTALLMVCGETNIIATRLHSEEIVDRFGCRDKLDKFRTKLILNPIHDYMVRHEMVKKRRALSAGGKTVVSVWNRGCKNRPEAQIPWGAYRDGKEITEEIVELDRPLSQQPGVRIGILSLT